MPRSNRFVRWLEIRFDKDAARRLKDDAEVALEKAGTASAAEFEGAMKVGGQKGARALTTSLQREYKLRMARLSVQLADGTINERDFRREGEKAAREFNAGLSSGIKRLQTSTGGLTDAQFIGLGSRAKTAGAAGAAAGAGMLAAFRASPLAGPLAGVLTASAGLRFAKESIEATDELEKSIRRLDGTAKIAGLNFDELTKAAERNREEFKLGTPIANDLTGFMTQLAARSGDASKAQEALAGWLDLAGSRGMTAAEAMQALEVTIRGQDEGLNRLGLQNPKEIYERWGASADEASQAAAILNEVITVGARVNGEWARSMETTAGQADQAAQKIRDLQAEIGKTFGPVKVLLLKIELVAVGALAWFIEAYKRTVLGAGADSGSTPMGFGDLRVLDEARNPRTTRVPLTPEEIAAAEKRLAGLFTRLQNWIDKNPLKLIGESYVRDELMAELEARRTRAKDFRARGGRLDPISAGQAPGAGGVFAGLTAFGVPELSPFEKAVQSAFINVESVSSDAAQHVAAAWQDAFSLMMEEGANVGNFFEGLGRGIAGSLGSALASFASGKAKENFAAAIEAAAYALGFTSHGNFVSASAAWASAGSHTAAGIAWSALGGAGAAGGGALRSRSPGSTHDAGLSTGRQTFDNGGSVGAEINIYFNGPDAMKPEFERTILGVVDRARERFPEGSKITIKPPKGRP